jgi:linoleoyl-CoA desaturase
MIVQHKVSFSKNNNEFVSELREKIKRYFEKENISKYGNASLVFKSFIMFSVYIAPFVLMLTGIIQTLPVFLLCWLFMGIGMAGVGMGVMHDANHRSFSQNNTVNKWLSKSAYLLGAYPKNWQFQHNTLHHGFTNIDNYDEDISPAGILRFSPHSPLYKIHKYQYVYAWFFYSLMSFSWIVLKDFTRLYRYKKLDPALKNQKKFNKSLLELIVSKIVYYTIFLVLPILLVPFAWYWVLLGFLSMHFVCGLILSTIFQTAHVVTDSEFPLPDENGSINSNWAVHQLKTTSDFSPKSIIFSWLIGGLNYQIEHHLFPNISHVHYRRISRIVKETAENYNLPYHVHSNFLQAVGMHVKMLKLLGKPYFI